MERALSATEAAEEIRHERCHLAQTQQFRYLPLSQLLCGLVSDQPLHNRLVDETERALVRTDQQGPGPDQVRGLFQGQLPISQSFSVAAVTSLSSASPMLRSV